MNILIQKVRVQNFRALKNVEVTLKPTTVLLGTNNAGKTSFLKALSLAIGIEKRSITNEDFFIDKDGLTTSNEILIDILIIPVNETYERQQEFDISWLNEFGDNIQDDNGYQFFAFRTKCSNNTPIKRLVIADWNNQSLISDNDTLKAKIDKLPLHFIHAQRDVQLDLSNKKSYLGKLSEQISVGDRLNAIEQQLNALNEEVIATSPVLEHLKSKLEELNETIHTTGQGVQITPLPHRMRDLPKSMQIYFQDGGSDSFSMEYHGMGTRSWASLLTFKAAISWENIQREQNNEPYHPILALEEPEAHLHPNAQRHVFQQLKTIHGQKIISSHSPFIAGQADLESIRCFHKKSDEVKVNSIFFGFKEEIKLLENELLDSNIRRSVRKEKVQKIKSLKDEEREFRRKVDFTIMKTRGDFFFSKVLVFFEGQTEEQALPILTKSYFGRADFELGITFISVGGQDYKHYIKIAESLNIPWFIFSDGETRAIENLDKIKQELNILNTNNQIFILPNQTDFESYLIQNGYESELKQAVIEYKTKNSDIIPLNQNQANQINNWTALELGNFLSAWKTKLAPIYAHIIANLGDDRRTPPKIKELFEKIEQIIQ